MLQSIKKGKPSELKEKRIELEELCGIYAKHLVRNLECCLTVELEPWA